MYLPSFRFNYKRLPARDPDTLEVKYCFYPFVPCAFSSGQRTTSSLEGLLDSGSDGVVIPQRIADYLGLELEKSAPARVVGTKIDCYRSMMSMTLGRGGRVSDVIRNVRVTVAKGDTPIILGRDPIFKLFRITFIEPERRLELLPYQESS
jgi:hypothetical protein